MDFDAAVHDQIALLRAGKPLEAFDRYFGEDGVMFDNDEVFGRGKVECRAKQAPFITAAQSITGKITEHALDPVAGICVLRNQSTFVAASGKTMQIDGVHWQRWADGVIVEERYYRGELMQARIEAGIFEL